MILYILYYILYYIICSILYYIYICSIMYIICSISYILCAISYIMCSILYIICSLLWVLFNIIYYMLNTFILHIHNLDIQSLYSNIVKCVTCNIVSPILSMSIKSLSDCYQAYSSYSNYYRIASNILKSSSWQLAASIKPLPSLAIHSVFQRQTGSSAGQRCLWMSNEIPMNVS